MPSDDVVTERQSQYLLKKIYIHCVFALNTARRRSQNVLHCCQTPLQTTILLSALATDGMPVGTAHADLRSEPRRLSMTTSRMAASSKSEISHGSEMSCTSTMRCSISPASAPKANNRSLPACMARAAVTCCLLHCARAAPPPPLLQKGFMCNAPTLLAAVSTSSSSAF